MRHAQKVWLRSLAAACLVVFTVASGAAQTRLGDVAIGESLIFKSGFIEGDIPVRIHQPAGYASGTSKYAVLYLLEVANDFVFASSAADFLAECGRIPGLVVVSIDVDKLSGPPQAMIAFLEKELFPYVERTYRTEPRRILYGHSGRSFAALFMMLTRPELFDAYICASLGLTWPLERGRMDFSALATERFAKLTSLPKVLVFSLGDEKPFFAGVERFMSVLRTAAPKGFRWTYLAMPNDDHRSTRLKTLYQGLEFVFQPGASTAGQQNEVSFGVRSPAAGK